MSLWTVASCHAEVRTTKPQNGNQQHDRQVGLGSCSRALIRLCSYGRVQRLQGIALASSLPSTEWTACFVFARSMSRPCRPAVLLPLWTLAANPEDLLVAVQAGVVREAFVGCVAFMVPLCQARFALRVLTLCKGWVPDPLLGLSIIGTLWAASLLLADALTWCCTPLVATHLTDPSNSLIALRRHAVRSTSICFIVPLSCHPGSLGCQGVVLAHFAPAALRATSATAPVCNGGFPAVQVAIWALLTSPPDHLVAVWLDVNRTQVGIGSMVPLLLKSWSKSADVWACLLCTCLLTLTGATAHT